MSARTLLIACLATVGLSVAGGATAQSYLQSGDLNSIRQSNQAVPGGPASMGFAPPAPRRDGAGGVGAQFREGMADGERQAQRQRESAAMSDMQMKALTDPQRVPQGRYPGASTNAQGAIYFNEQGPTACKQDPVSGQVQCGATTSR
ncbi:hypothetical protein PEP31012_02906 [Pandoraea eparura]|uniref:Uncharacterized protein n=1 Tax=Pandoraea eparura TaxID=2508291 RepID=A0A5E4VZ90_9BURK|nr:hypothetical protein [Pandoraea eparura]VVE16340.1 hypothetical protein PEP31012_02906 [Pandoraea eparura]